MLPVVQPGTTDLTVGEREPERVNEMKSGARGETRSPGIAGIPVNFGADERHVERHGGIITVMLRKIAVTAVIALAVFVVSVGATRSRGVRRPPATAPVPGGPTFSNEVVRIFQDNCQGCHHPGDIAPFSLMTYNEAKPWANSIKLMTQLRKMPPWKPVNGCGTFADERVLSQDEINTIAKWVDNGAPEGDRSSMPSPLNFDGGWTLGLPDLIFANPDPYTAPAGADVYRCFVMPKNEGGEKWVSAIDVKPGDRKSVHHVIAYLDTTGQSLTLDSADPAPGYTCFGGPGFDLSSDATLGGWAPGYRPTMLPEEVGFKLPANSRVVLQVHYNSHAGVPAADQTSIGIYLAKKQPSKQMHILPIVNQTFTIPPNDSNYRVDADFPLQVPVATHVWLIAPHMHLLGRQMRVEMKAPNQNAQCLINIDDWDFNWQGLYRYQEPVAVPAFSRLSLTAYYDNSLNNFRNPSAPPKPVSWGEMTTDEMCLAFLGVTIDAVKGDASWIPALPAR